MSTPYLGQITMFGGGFAISGWAFCNGQLLPISQNTALFSLLGTAYGGDGITTFALPNLQSRLPVNQGHGAGLSNYVLGQVGGTVSVNIDMTTMPLHTHGLNATTALATTGTIGSSVIPAQPTGSTKPLFYAAPTQGQPPPVPQQMATGTCGVAGGGQPHTNMMPSLCVTFIIALVGVYPSRS